nr:hypothetical protein [Tanacetum cinerariifolium]
MASSTVLGDGIVTGGKQPIPDITAAHVVDIAKLAVDEHNKKAKTSLKFVKIIKGESQVMDGIYNFFTITAKDDDVENNYAAILRAKTEKPYWELVLSGGTKNEGVLNSSRRAFISAVAVSTKQIYQCGIQFFELDHNITVPSSSTTTNETCKPQGVDQNKMHTLKDLSQSMFKNIKVIDAIFQARKRSKTLVYCGGPEVPSYKQSGVVKANEPVYPIRNKSMNLLDGSWFTRISYADGLSTIIPYAPIRSDSGQEQAVYYQSYRALRRMIRRTRRCASRSTLQQPSSNTTSFPQPKGGATKN